jgi:hypothetical protein
VGHRWSGPLTLEPPRQQGHGSRITAQAVARTGQDPQLGSGPCGLGELPSVGDGHLLIVSTVDDEQRS